MLTTVNANPTPADAVSLWRATKCNDIAKTISRHIKPLINHKVEYLYLTQFRN